MKHPAHLRQGFRLRQPPSPRLWRPRGFVAQAVGQIGRRACVTPLVVALALVLTAPCLSGPIYTVDVTDADPATLLTIESLQGLVNRTAGQPDQPATLTADQPSTPTAGKPSIYLLRNPEDAYWLVQYTRSAEPISPQDFIAKFKDRAAGQILYDPDRPFTAHVALAAAGALDAVVTPTDLGLKTIFDARREWKTAADAYRWAIGNLLRRCSRQKIGIVTPTGDGPRDYFVKERIFVLGLDPEQPQDRRLIEQALRRMPAGIVVIGPPALQDEPWASLIRRDGHSLLPCSPLANLSFHSAFPPAVPLSQGRRLAPDDDKPLVTFVYLGSTDLAYALRGMVQFWMAPGRGSVPLGWMVSPALLDFAPAVLQRYWAQAALSGSDQFIMVPNGSDAFPLTGNRYLVEALYRLRGYTERADLGVLAVSTPGSRADVSAVLERVIREGGVRGVLALQGTEAQSALYADSPVVAETVRATTPFDTLLAIRDAAQREKYIFVAVPPQAMSPADIAMVATHLGDEVHVVGPLDLIAAARHGAVVAAAKPAEKATYEVAEVTLAPAERIAPTDQVAVTARTTVPVDAARLIYKVGDSPAQWTEPMTRLGDGSFVGLLPPMLHGGVVQVRVETVGAQGTVLSSPEVFEVRAPDGDGDDLTDADETLFHSDPDNPDTDGDGLLDGHDPAPLRATSAPSTYLPPIVPPADGHVLAADSGSSLVEAGRQVTGDAHFTYRLPLDAVPEGTDAVLLAVVSGPAALSASTDGETFAPVAAASASEPGPQALQWAIPGEALAAGALSLRFAAAGEAAQQATLHSVSIGSSPEAPSVILRGLEPGSPAPGLRNAAVAKVYDPDGLESVVLLYRIGRGAPVARPMEKWQDGHIYAADLPDLASGNVISIQVKATDKQGRTIVTPALAFPVGITRAETISLLAAHDFEGEMRPWPAAGPDWRWAAGGQSDRASASLLGGRYFVWLLAAPRGAGLYVEVDGQRIGEGIERDAPDGWQRVGSVDLEEGKHTFAVVCGPEGPKEAVRGYAQLLLSAGSAAAPRGALITDYLNTISILSPQPDATLSRRVSVRATASGNVVRAECYVDRTRVGRDRRPPYEFRWDTRDFTPGEHTIEVKAINGAGEAMLTARISINIVR